MKKHVNRPSSKQADGSLALRRRTIKNLTSKEASSAAGGLPAWYTVYKPCWYTVREYC
jgi:hypothetical protein